MNSKAFDCKENDAVLISDSIIEELFNTYADMIYRLAFVRTKSHSDSDDIVQEVFLRMLRSSSIFEDAEHQKAWLIRTAINCTNTLLTSSWRKNRDQQQEDGQYIADLETKTEVYSAVLKLPLKQRTAIHLFYYQGYKITEIAEIMRTKENTVKSWLSRARQALKDELKDTEF